jgi:hypothetical protein
VTHRDPLLQSYEETIPGQFRVLQSFEVHQATEKEAAPEVQVTIRLQSVKDARLLKLKFEGVRDLRLIQPDWSLLELPVLEIHSIRERQMEGLNYEVRESDNDTVAFTCRTFSVLVES